MTDRMITLAPENMEPRDAYKIMLSVIVPRPIAWISSLGADGTVNLAPYSFFSGVSGHPPVVMFSVSQRSARFGGGVKDTLRNVQETGEFVVNVVNEPLVEAMNQTAGEWDYGVSEFEQAGLATAPSVVVKPPRVAAAPVAMEAKVHQVVPVDGSNNTMVLGRIVRYHIREDLLRSEGLVDAALMRPVARLGGPEYARLGEVFSLERPQV